MSQKWNLSHLVLFLLFMICLQASTCSNDVVIFLLIVCRHDIKAIYQGHQRRARQERWRSGLYGISKYHYSCLFLSVLIANTNIFCIFSTFLLCNRINIGQNRVDVCWHGREAVPYYSRFDQHITTPRRQDDSGERTLPQTYYAGDGSLGWSL